jgi:hypothetical protein
MAKARMLLTALLIAAVVAPAAAGLLDALTGALSWTVELAVLLAQKQPRLKQIYLSHFGAGGPAGTLHPNLTIAADGTVTAVEIESDTIGDAAFAEAIRKEVLTWEMPGSTWNMELGFDLEFDPARDLYGVDVEIEE